MLDSTNIHANSLIIGNQGILIFGEPGFGKTSLMLQLLDQSKKSNIFASMIADDQSLVSNANNCLIAHCPIATQGKLEIRGHGIVKLPFLPSAVINIMVKIVLPEKIVRMPKKNSNIINGVQMPLIYVPRYDLQQSMKIILATLDV